MLASALFLGFVGLLFSFLPQEVLGYLSIQPDTINVLLMQIMSALYLGLALLNWMSKGTLIGGIKYRIVNFASGCVLCFCHSFRLCF